MVFMKAAVVGVTLLSATVQGHGRLCTFTAGDKTYQNINQDKPVQGDLDVGWHSTADKDPITGGSYHDILSNRTVLTDDFTCGQRYRPGPDHATVEAGSTVTVNWCGWGTNHRGGIFDYLAPCNGDCDKADRSQLEWIKIGELGLIEPNVIPHPDNNRWNAAPGDTTPRDRNVGYWATDLLDDLSKDHKPDGWESGPDHTIMQDSPWKIQIPKNLKPGKYILRTEIYALFGGTQLYPRCVNLDIVGTGSDVPAGVTYRNLYDFSDPTSTIWFQDLHSNWTLQGPALYSGAANPNPNLALGNKSPPGPDVAISKSPVSGGSSSTPSDKVPSMTGTSKMSPSSSADAQGSAASSKASSSPSSSADAQGGAASSKAYSSPSSSADAQGSSASKASSSPSPTSATDCSEAETTTVTETVTVTGRPQSGYKA